MAIYNYFFMPGTIVWFLVYFFLIRRGLLEKRCPVPMVLICLWLPSEFHFGFIEPNHPLIFHGNKMFFLCDVIVALLFLKYGKKDLPAIIPHRLVPPIFFFFLLLSYGWLVCFVYQFQDLSGLYSSFLYDLLIPIFFINMLIRRGSTVGQSIYIPICMLTGHILFSIGCYFLRPASKFLTYSYFAGVILYLSYIVLLYRQFQLEKVNPWKKI